MRQTDIDGRFFQKLLRPQIHTDRGLFINKNIGVRKKLLQRRSLPRRDSIENLSFWTASDTKRFINQHKDLVDHSKAKKKPADSELLSNIRIASVHSRLRKQLNTADNRIPDFKHGPFELKGTEITMKPIEPIQINLISM